MQTICIQVLALSLNVYNGKYINRGLKRLPVCNICVKLEKNEILGPLHVTFNKVIQTF